MALYLTYRPRTFADVLGQDHIVTTLEQAAKKRQFGHAYLFCGTRGTGKTSVARILARSIMLDGIDDAGHRERITKAMDEESLVDMVEIDAASTRGIDDIRSLIEKVSFRPTIARAKVYIIDEVHMLTKEAFNALLKTLEEPPEYAYFILATTELHKVPDTIQSRCQRFLFRRVKDDDIVTRLQYIVDQEKISTDRDALRSIARHAGGSFRDGISLLDQLRSLPHITASDVIERTGSPMGTLIDDLATALLAHDGKRISAEIARMEQSNIPAELIANGLLQWARSAMRSALEDGEEIDPWIRTIDALLTTLKLLRTSPMPGLSLEASLLGLACITSKRSSTSSIEKHQERPTMPQETSHEKVPVSAAAPASSPAPTAAPTPLVVQAEELTITTLKKHWETILKLVTPASVRMSLKNATITAVEGTTVHLAFESAFHRDRVAETQACRTVEDVIGKVFRCAVGLRCVLASAPGSNTSTIQTEQETDLAAAAIEVFGSSIRT